MAAIWNLRKIMSNFDSFVNSGSQFSKFLDSPEAYKWSRIFISELIEVCEILEYIMSGLGNNIHSFYQFVASCLPRLPALILQYCGEKMKE